jgi:ATP-binding cassette subfamily B protein
MAEEKQKNKKEEKKRIDFKYNLSRYLEILKPYKWYIFGTLFFLLIVEAVDVGVNFLYKLLVDKGTGFVAGTIAKEAFIATLLMVGGIFIAVQAVRTISNWFHHGFLNRLETKAIFSLKKKYFEHIIGLSHSFYTSHKTGSLISRLTRGSSAMERMTDVIVFNAMPLLFNFTIAVISLIYFDLIPALIVIGILVVFIAWSMIIQRLQEPSNIKANENEDFEKANVADIFTNIESIKYFGKEDYIKKKFLKLADTTTQSYYKNWNYYKIMSTGQIVILGLGTLFLIYSTIMRVLSGDITMGTLVFVYSVYGGLLPPLYSFVYGVRGFYRSMADFQDLFAYGKIEKEVKDKVNAQELDIKEGNVEFKDIDFNYGKRKIFEKFNLNVDKNKKVALVGHSGSGKSTLVKLLYRLYDVNSGAILIDGKDIREFTQESLRNEMSIVPQECVLFDDTIFNNVLFSRPNASKSDVMKAIKLAQLDKIISNFPNKENTIVGERGVKLSGGEKQRVSIARALLADKKILVLDEATSSLDSETEYEIQQDLKQLMKGRTTIVIAHRLSTIMSADKIVVMKNGKIVQMGNHNKLIGELGEYRKLWNLQKGGYIK